MSVDVYNSNEEAIAKLEAAGGTSGYDIVVPTGVVHPADGGRQDLIQKLDLTLIPNFGNVDPIYINQSFDPGNKYTCPRTGARPAGSTTTPSSPPR